MATGKFNPGENPAMDWHPIRGGGGRNTPCRFMLRRRLGAGGLGMYAEILPYRLPVFTNKLLFSARLNKYIYFSQESITC